VDVVTFTEFLLDSTLKSTAILSIALALMFLLRRSSSAIRHSILTSAMVVALFVPIGTTVLVDTPAYELFTIDVAGSMGLTLTPEAESGDTDAAPIPLWQIYLTSVWLIGLVLMLLRSFFGIVGTSIIVRSAAEIQDERLKQLFVQAIAQQPLRRPVKLLVSPRTTVSFTCGLITPLIILPPAAVDWSDETARMFILHELAHVRRRDILSAWISLLIHAVYWFNPLVWLCQRWVHLEREKTCDDYVLSSGVHPSDYAEQLLSFWRNSKPSGLTLSLGIALTRRRYLMKRVSSLFVERNRTPVLARTTMVTIIVVTFMLAVPLAWTDTTPVLPPEYEPPEMTVTVRPDYPAEARNAGLTGLVWLKVFVDTSGVVQNAKIQKSSGHAVLDSAAVMAGKQCKFEPAKIDGKATPTWVTFSYQFAPEIDD